MKVDFKKESIHVSEMRMPQMLPLLVEGDVIVPDVKPDMKDILLTEANAVITDKSYSDGKLMLSGIVTVHILYIPEGDRQPRSIETKLPFKESADAEADAFTSIFARTEHVDFAMIHSRKLHVKVVVSLTAKAYAEKEISYVADVNESASLKIRKCGVSAYHAVADTAKEIVVGEMLEVPAAKPDIEEVIQLDAHAIKDECKVMSGKILLKGTLAVNCLYRSVDDDSGIECLEYELPFSEILDVEGLEDDCLCHVHYEIKDVYFTVKENGDGDTRIIMLDVVLSAGVIAGKTEDFEAVDDCYSTEGSVNITRERVHLDELLSEGTSHAAIKEIISVAEEMPQISVVYTLRCKPLIKEIHIADDKLTVGGKLVVFMLYGSSQSEQAMHSLIKELDFEHSVPVDGLTENTLCECNPTDTTVSFSINAAGEVELRCVAEFYLRAIKRVEQELITGCEMSEAPETPRNKGLVIYFVQNRDTLWDVAKRYRTDVEKIRLINKLTEENPAVGQKLLIPRS